MLQLRCKTILATALCAAACSRPGFAQVVPPAILEIDVENTVRYDEDISDASKFATDAGPTTASPLRTFGRSLFLTDVVAVNGQPAKGTLVINSRAIFLTPAPNAGQAVADTTQSLVNEFSFEILNSDGSGIGTIAVFGLSGGGPPPGAPLQITQGNSVIVGGTGAFLGARGQIGQAVTSQFVPSRVASVAEDPANRRRNGGGKQRWVLQIIPMFWPQIIAPAGVPAVTHSSDFTVVTASKPAAAGEILSLFATGLGPTRPGINPGQPFPSSPLASVNSPVQVTVNGKTAKVTAAVGFPAPWMDIK